MYKYINSKIKCLALRVRIYKLMYGLAFIIQVIVLFKFFINYK
jgi:hypothetical protein